MEPHHIQTCSHHLTCSQTAKKVGEIQYKVTLVYKQRGLGQRIAEAHLLPSHYPVLRVQLLWIHHCHPLLYSEKTAQHILGDSWERKEAGVNHMTS